MPELPEVETIARDLRKHVTGLRIKGVAIYDPRVIRGISPPDFVRRVKGQKISLVARRGKAIIISLIPDRDFLVVQPMMTGQLIAGDKEQKNKATKLTIRLSNGHYLHYNDFRLFGRWQVVRDLQEIPYLRTIGPEPLEPGFGSELIVDRLKKHRISIKALLLDPSLIAGIGNIYASEILFRCGIDPRRKACRLSQSEAEAICQATVDVLKEAVRLRGTSMFTYRDGKGRPGRFKKRLRVYDREDESCCGCGQPIRRVMINGRSTYYCGSCQR